MSTRAYDLDTSDTHTMVDMPTVQIAGKNKRKAWERGFDARCWTPTAAPGLPDPLLTPYYMPVMKAAFALGWRAADALIQERRPR